MVEHIAHKFPSQYAVRVVSHVGREARTPDMLSRVILTTHLLRALSRADSQSDRQIDENGPLSVISLTDQLQKWRHLPVSPYASGTGWKHDAARTIEEAREVFKYATRLGSLEGSGKKNDIAELGLSFLTVLAEADTDIKEKSIKSVYADNVFLTLGVAREVLRDINKETSDKSDRNFTNNPLFDPLTHVEKFYAASKQSLPSDLLPRDASPDKMNEAVISLTDLAVKLHLYTQSISGHTFVSPHSAFTFAEAASLRTLRDYVLPYKFARDFAMKAESNGAGRHCDIVAFGKLKKRGDGIIRNLPALVPPGP